MAAKISELTNDAFLGGKLKLLQPKIGFRAGIDSVLLAASVRASSGDRVLDIGTGVGTALFCLMKRVIGLEAVGIELQEEYHSLATENSKKNMLKAKILLGDFQSPKNELNNCLFDEIFFNPPYYSEETYKKSGNISRDLANIEKQGVLENMLKFSLKRCKPYGFITLINRPARLGKILSVLENGAGDIRLLPVQSSKGQPSLRIIIRARKSARGETKLLEGLKLFKDTLDQHKRKIYTSQLVDILKHGKPLEF